MQNKKPKIHYELWAAQILLALLFVFSGVSKFYLSATETTQISNIHFSLNFYRFIGFCESLGGIGLILPSFLKIKPLLTPLAALGLFVIMLGATITTLLSRMGIKAIVPFVLSLVCLFIAYGRYKIYKII